MTKLTARPFRARVAGDVRAGRPAELIVEVGQPLQPGTAGAYDTAVRGFVDLAIAGGLCGSMLDPVRDSARNVPPDSPTALGQTLRWVLPGIAVDPLAINVLLNLCETIGEAAGLSSVELIAVGPDVLPDTDPDEYPAIPSTLPFECEIDLAGRHVGVEMDFSTAPEPRALELLRADLETWGLVAAMGGFRWADATPLEGIAVLAEIPDPTPHGLAFELLNTTAHPAAFDSMVGVLSRAARTYLPIVEVRIES
jgi:hypothetical protein